MTLSHNPDKYPHQKGWRAYQAHLRRNQKTAEISRKKRLRRRLIAGGLVAILSLLLVTSFWPDGRPKAPIGPATAKPGEAQASGSAGQTVLVKKPDVHILLGKTHLMNVVQEPVRVSFDHRPYLVHTSLDIDLQEYLIHKLDRVNSRYIGIVAMDPDTGRILAMVGFNKINPDADPCLLADYPSASLFKIVTAAAAIEEKGYTARTRLKFNGYKHTLYKRQLTDKSNRYTSAISLKNAFAQSVNPVFGKMGALYLDRQDLIDYGNAFGFNRGIEFELPFSKSHLEVGAGTYERAEIASGFNRQTRISPLHGAVIVSAVVNDGKPVEPTLVDHIDDTDGHTVYQSSPRFLTPAVSAKTARELEKLMAATIKSGTAKKRFRGHTRNKVLKRLDLGGKTGSIANRKHDARFDWFVGYAAEKKGSEKIVVSVMVAHEEYIGIRAAQYGRMVIERHFKEYFAGKDHPEKKQPKG